MARTLLLEHAAPGVPQAGWPAAPQDLRRSMLGLLVLRALILFAGINLAEAGGMLPSSLDKVPIVPWLNTVTVALALAYLAAWWNGKEFGFQLHAQIAIDLALTSVLVALSRGTQSPFVSFYLLIIMYSSLMLGRTAGALSAASSTILYAVIVAAGRSGALPFSPPDSDLTGVAFRISSHALGFFAVAFLGTGLSGRLYAVEQELVQKMDSLERLQRLNALIVRSIRSGLVTTDLDGRIALFNAAAAELTERPGQDMVGHPVAAVIGDEFWQRIRTQDLLRDPRPLRHEAWVSVGPHTSRFLGFSVSPLMDNRRRQLGYILSFQDLTDIQRLQEEVLIKDRMADIGRMAAGLAHEIRNPLTSMRGSVEILRSHLKVSEQDGRLLDILIRESDRLNTFIEDFLCLARPGNLKRSRFDLAALVTDWATLARNSAEVEGKHSVALELCAQTVPVSGDPDRLKQVFWNLAQNAFRAMPGGGTLAVSAARLADGSAQVRFVDEGIGMTPAEKEQLFRPFRSGFAGGCGLGLSIVFQIVQDHHGSISIDSEKGRGTAVTLTLPPSAAAASD